MNYSVGAKTAQYHIMRIQNTNIYSLCITERNIFILVIPFSKKRSVNSNVCIGHILEFYYGAHITPPDVKHSN